MAPKVTNKECWKEALRYLAGGVNSPVRSFRAVGKTPFFVDRGQGAYLWDVEGHKLLDYVCSWGTLILGHRHPEVLKAVEAALQRGTSFGTPTPQETHLAKAIAEAIPSMEQVRFVTSGTEAVMSAIRLARAATGRRKILKFDGGYHGHFDALLTKAGSGMATLGLPSSPGVPESVTGDTVTISFNDAKAVAEAIRQYAADLACVLVEPILANVGVIPPEKGFLEMLRRLTKEKNILLIFDEVITGFRVSYHGAQGLYEMRPDLTTLGKVIGGGFPIGAYGGKRSLMSLVAPAGPVYQAGTLAGHPIAMAAGLATLKVLRQSGTYEQLEKQGKKLRDGLLESGRRNKIPLAVHQVGGLLSLFFTQDRIRNMTSTQKASPFRYARYFQEMLKRGVYLPPSAFESWFLSTAHGEKELKMTLSATEASFKEMTHA